MMKKHAVVDIFGRELGNLSTRKFAHHFAASEDLIMRLERARTLEKHSGSVSTLSFNSDGDILVSGSDDRDVILWDWETGCVKLSFNSRHRHKVLEAKIMPETDDRSIVTCCADGQVRHATILECGTVETKLLGRHYGAAHKIANVPESPHVFYTCGDDGLVQNFDLRTRKPTKLFTCQPACALSCRLVINLNAIAIDPRHNASAAFGKPADYFCPKHLLLSSSVGITGLAFSDQSELLVSYSRESIYRFFKDMGWGDESQLLYRYQLCVDSDVKMETKRDPLLFKGHWNYVTVKGVGFFGPKCEYVVSGSDCGRVFIWRNNDAKLVRIIKEDKHLGSCIEAHPRIPILASSGIYTNIKIWTPTALERAGPPKIIEKNRLRPVVHRRASPRRSDSLCEDNKESVSPFEARDLPNRREKRGGRRCIHL